MKRLVKKAEDELFYDINEYVESISRAIRITKSIREKDYPNGVNLTQQEIQELKDLALAADLLMHAVDEAILEVQK